MKWSYIVEPFYECILKKSKNLCQENTISTKKRNKSFSDPSPQNKKFKQTQSKDKLNFNKSLDDLSLENDPFMIDPQSSDDVHSSTGLSKSSIHFD